MGTPAPIYAIIITLFVRIAIVAMLFGQAPPAAESTAPPCAGMAYLWHRARGKEVDDALKSFKNWKIFALFAEIRQDKPIVVRKHLPGTVPVIRLDQFCWRKDGFLKTFVPLLKQLPKGEVQLDCDVPESKIAAYADFLKQLKKQDANHTFSATLLPCHLRHPELKAVLDQLDYTVLQLHALEIPKSLPDEYRLFDSEVADKAVQAMKMFRKTFRIALPSYAYTIHYTKDGRFRRMSAENEVPQRQDEIRKTAQPDWNEVLKFRKKHPALEVIWFRLPLKGDRLALEATNLLLLNQGKPPRKEIEAIFRHGRVYTDVFWKNHGLLGRTTHTMALGGTGETFLFNGAAAVGRSVPGIVPASITGTPPPPGETLLVARIVNWGKKDKIK
jgi:hypothetical protein